jgi:hypothetical protein
VKTLFRILKSLALFFAAAFCGFGFMASFEPGNDLLWKAGYGLLSGACLFKLIAMWRRKP